MSIKDRIEVKAYHKFLRRQKENIPGDQFHDWLSAEHEEIDDRVRTRAFFKFDNRKKQGKEGSDWNDWFDAFTEEIKGIIEEWSRSFLSDVDNLAEFWEVPLKCIQDEAVRLSYLFAYCNWENRVKNNISESDWDDWFSAIQSRNEFLNTI